LIRFGGFSCDGLTDFKKSGEPKTTKTMQTTFNTNFIVRSAKARNGMTPIYCRITVDGQRAEFSIQKSVSEKNWNNGKPKGNTEEVRSLISYLKQIEAKIFEHYRSLLADNKLVTADGLKNAYLGIAVNQHTLLNLIDYHNTQLRDTLEWGTMKNYMTTQRYLKEFLKSHTKAIDIPLHQLSYKFIADFEFYLRSYKPVDYHASIGNNTVMKHIERLRKMINLAIKNEWLKRDPFAKFKARFIRNDREFLTQDNLERIEGKEFNLFRLQWAKDLFIFSCYTGLAYCDAMNLRPQNISLGMDGEHWIMTSRKKTNQPVRVPLLPVAHQLIQKYKNHPRALVSGTVFPILSNQKLNSYLKEIADLCGIEKKLTFHLARHTFATTITLNNGVPIETVSKMLGHSSIRTTQIYSKVVEKKISQDMFSLRIALEKQKSRNSEGISEFG
jgi:site-specific recombinase XerD